MVNLSAVDVDVQEHQNPDRMAGVLVAADQAAGPPRCWVSLRVHRQRRFARRTARFKPVRCASEAQKRWCRR